MAKSEQTHVWGSPFFRDLVADRVRFVLTRYLSRKSKTKPFMGVSALSMACRASTRSPLVFSLKLVI